MKHAIHENWNCTNNNTFTIDKTNWSNKMKKKIVHCKNKIPTTNRGKRRKSDTTNTYFHVHCFHVFFFILPLLWCFFFFICTLFWCVLLYLYIVLMCFSLFLHCFEVGFFICKLFWGAFHYLYIVLMCFSLFVHCFEVFFFIYTLFWGILSLCIQSNLS